MLLIIPLSLFGAHEREFTDAQEEEFNELAKKWTQSSQNRAPRKELTSEEKTQAQNAYVRIRTQEADLKLYRGTYKEKLVLNIDYRRFLNISSEEIKAYATENSLPRGSVCVSYKFPMTKNEIESIFDALKESGFEQILIYQNNSSWQTVIIDWRLDKYTNKAGDDNSE